MAAALGFLIIGFVFIISLIKSTVSLIEYDWKENEFSLATLAKIYKLSFLSLLALILFIAFVLPYLK